MNGKAAGSRRRMAAYPDRHRVQLRRHRGCRIRQPGYIGAALRELLTARVLAHRGRRALSDRVEADLYP